MLCRVESSADPAELGGNGGNHGGEGGIRTLEGRKPLAVFKTAAFNRSATSPHKKIGQLERISGGMYPATPALIQQPGPKH